MVWPALIALAGTAYSAYNANKAARRQRDQEAAATEARLNLGREGANMAGFTPVNVTTGLTGANPTYDSSGRLSGYSTTMDPNLRGAQQGAVAGANSIFSNLGNMSPEALAGSYYSNFQKMAGPERMNQFSDLQNRLAGQGLLGLNANKSSAGGITTSGNPFYGQFLEANANADRAAFERAYQFGNEQINQNINRGKTLLGTGLGIDDNARQNLSLSGELGSQQALAGARQGQLLTGQAGAISDLAGANQQYTATRNNQVQGLLGGLGVNQFGMNDARSIWNSAKPAPQYPAGGTNQMGPEDYNPYGGY